MAHPLIRLTVGLGALGAGALGWALAEARAYTLRRFEVPVLPPGSTPVRLLHISDLHLVPGDRRRIRWVRRLSRFRPDVVITTGDNLAHGDAVPAVADAMEPFLHLPGAFVTGSNDYYLPILKNPFAYFRKGRRITRPAKAPTLPAGDLISMLASGGWHHVDNRRAEVTAGGSRIAIVGTGDAHIDDDRYPVGRNSSAADVTIGVTHAPYRRVLERMRIDGVDLALAGHTHGGQVCLPGYGALVTNCDIDRRMVKGLHRWPGAAAGAQGEEQMWLHVSAGLGTSPFTPIRFACRPEATLLELTARNA